VNRWPFFRSLNYCKSKSAGLNNYPVCVDIYREAAVEVVSDDNDDDDDDDIVYLKTRFKPLADRVMKKLNL